MILLSQNIKRKQITSQFFILFCLKYIPFFFQWDLQNFSQDRTLEIIKYQNESSIIMSVPNVPQSS